MSAAVLESLVNLISKLDFVQGNVEICSKLKAIYRSTLLGSNFNKKDSVGLRIKESLEPVYNKHREDILQKDFTFVAEHGLTIDSHSEYQQLYINTFSSDDETSILLAQNELLYLFYLVAPDNDRDTINEKYSRKKEPDAPTTAKAAATAAAKSIPSNMVKNLATILKEHQHELKAAEKDPSKVPDVINGIFTKNSKDMSVLVGHALSNMVPNEDTT